MLRALWESKWLWRLVLAGVLLLVGYAMARAIAQISAEDFTLQPSSLILAFLCAFLGHLSQFLNWVLIAASFGIRMPLARSGKAYFLSRLGRYVPGKVALILMRFKEYNGHSRRAITMAMGVDYVSSWRAPDWSCWQVLRQQRDSFRLLCAMWRWRSRLCFYFVCIHQYSSQRSMQCFA